MRNIKYDLYKIYAISFVDLFAVGLMFPLLQPHLRSLGASHFTIGLIGSTYSGLQVLSGPLIGSWSDFRGRKSILLSTLSICVVSYFVLGFVSSIPFVFLLRVILGFVKSTQTLCKATIADLVPREEQPKAFGRSAGLGALGFVVGPIIGGHISQWDNGFRYVCCLTSCLFLVNMILSLLLPNTKGSSPVSQSMDTFQLIKGIHKELKKAIDELIRIDWSTYWDAFLMRFLFGLSTSIFFTSQSLYLKEKHELSQLYIGYTISFLSIVGVVTSFFIGTISETFYKNDFSYLKRIHHFFTVFSVCFVGFYLAPNLYVFYMFLIPFSIASTFLRIISMEMMLTKSKNDEKGSLSGASNSIMSVARFVTPLTSGIIGDILGEEFVMFSAFIPSFIGVIVTFRLLYFYKKSKNE